MYKKLLNKHKDYDLYYSIMLENINYTQPNGKAIRILMAFSFQNINNITIKII